MAEVSFLNANTGLSETNSPLVSVSFQRDEQRKLKFLEGEPKALGITQICLIIFHTSCIAMLLGNGLTRFSLEIPMFILSIFVFIAGIVAVAAKNLHLPTLKACLGMEIVASAACFINLNLTLTEMTSHHFCYYDGPASLATQYCKNRVNTRLHLFAELVVIQVILFAISITLVVYACKVVNCCSTAPKVPVITIQAPPPPQGVQAETKP